MNTIQSRGLLGLALDPNFSTNHRVFICSRKSSTPRIPMRTAPRAARSCVSQQAGNPNAVDPASAVTLLTGYQSLFREHTVGALRFDAAGRLLACSEMPRTSA